MYRYKRRRSYKKLVTGILMFLPLITLCGVRIVESIKFDRDCGGHIKRAADANTVEMATEEMKTVVRYLEGHQMTEGFTSVVYNTPDEDLRFWYQNLKASLEELEKVQPETSQLERSNILLKLRQTLLDQKDIGERVTNPMGISVFPRNTGYAVGFLIFILFGIFGAVLIIWQNATDY